MLSWHEQYSNHVINKVLISKYISEVYRVV